MRNACVSPRGSCFSTDVTDDVGNVLWYISDISTVICVSNAQSFFSDISLGFPSRYGSNGAWSEAQVAQAEEFIA